LPEAMRRALAKARQQQGYSQEELGRRAGLQQRHISAIENGQTVPRVDTLIDLVRAVGHDLLLVPRELVPIVESLVREHGAATDASSEDRSLYSLQDEDEEESPA
jgi:HTH-type transcriptional regulator / antitoxin HipB